MHPAEVTTLSLLRLSHRGSWLCHTVEKRTSVNKEEKFILYQKLGHSIYRACYLKSKLLSRKPRDLPFTRCLQKFKRERL